MSERCYFRRVRLFCVCVCALSFLSLFPLEVTGDDAKNASIPNHRSNKNVGPQAMMENSDANGFNAEDARRALIQMIAKDHADDALLQAAIPYIRDAKVESVDGVENPKDWIKLAAWECNLKKKTFVGTYSSGNTFAEFFGDFVLDGDKKWKGVVREITRN